MSNLAHRQKKIQDKRKQTPWREFVMEICSWWPVGLYRNLGLISRYAPTNREGLVESLLIHNKADYSFNEFDRKVPFYDQIKNLFLISKKPAIAHFLLNENSDYTDGAYGCKSCYINFSAGLDCQNCCYSICLINGVINTYNSFSITDYCTDIYQSSIVTNGYNVFYSFNIHNCSDIWFCSNMIGCKYCIGCEGLENQRYCINNKNLTQEEYNIQHKQYLSQKHSFEKYYSQTSKQGSNYQSTNVSGSAVSFSQNVNGGFAVTRVNDSQNIIYGSGAELGCSNSFDCIDLCNNAHYMYANSGSGFNAEHFYCTLNSGEGVNIYYSMFLESCSFCLGCVGLKNKSFCILNKQYTKEAWYDKVDEVFAQMDADGTLGNFFPATMNPFYFNDTAAYLIDPSFTKEEVTTAGYLRRDEPIKVDIPEGVTVVSTKDLGQYEGWMVGTKFFASDTGPSPTSPFQGENIQSDQAKRYINPDILKVIIQDEQGNVYKIVKMEYDFLMKHELPLPRTHRLDRMKENFRIN